MSAVPTTERNARADAQRHRILNAAQACFIERGFHAASMASIAETADMSPGLIYRYFDSKSAIIRGIVERQLELLAQDLAVWRGDANDLTDALVRNCDEDEGERRLHPVLLLEIWAEASRDPTIAAAVEDLDHTIDRSLGAWLARPLADGGAGLSPEQIPARVLLLRCLIDGLKARQTRDPNLDRALLHQALQLAIPAIVTP